MIRFGGEIKMTTHKKSAAKTIAKGAAGVAAAAGVVAGVAAMADKETRNTLIKGAEKVVDAATSKKVSEAVGGQYQSAAHQIRLATKKKSTQKKIDSK